MVFKVREKRIHCALLDENDLPVVIHPIELAMVKTVDLKLGSEPSCLQLRYLDLHS